MSESFHSLFYVELGLLVTITSTDNPTNPANPASNSATEVKFASFDGSGVGEQNEVGFE